MLQTRTVVVATMGVLILPMCARLAAGQKDDPCGSGAVARFNELRLKHGVAPLKDDASLSKAAHKLGIDASQADPNSDASPPPCGKSIQTGDTPGSIVFNCDSGYTLSSCAQYENNDDACTEAVHDWTSYKWVFSETPLEDNPQGMEFGQIVWSRATKAGCASAKSATHASCVYFICLFDEPLERTNEALKNYVQPESKLDLYKWCSALASGEARELCTDPRVQCNGGPMAKCCPVSCAAASKQ